MALSFVRTSELAPDQPSDLSPDRSPHPSSQPPADLARGDHRSDAEPERARAVVAVVVAGHRPDAVLSTAIDIAEATGRPLRILVLCRRVGLSTDAALVAGARRRIDADMAQVTARMAAHLEGRQARPTLEHATFRSSCFTAPRRRAWHRAVSAARRGPAHVLVVPTWLVEAGHRPADLDVVRVADEVADPFVACPLPPFVSRAAVR